MSTNVGSIHYDLSLNTAKFDAQAAAVSKKVSTIGQSMQDFGAGMAQLGTSLTLAVTAPLTIAGTLGVKTAANLETARQGFITLLGSAKEADKTMAKIKQEAARTPFTIPGLTSATQLLASITKDGDKALSLVMDIGEGLAAMGKGQAELDRISVNLQQIANVGHASMLDIKQFAFAGIPIFEMLSEQTGLAGEALDKFISDGGVSFDLLKDMFDKANDEGGRFFNAYKNQAGTLNQSMSNLVDSFQIALSDMVVSSGLFDVIKEKVKSLTDFIGKLSDYFKKLTPEQKSLVVNLLIFAAVLGPVLIIVGKLVSGIGAIATAFSAITPVGWVVIAVLAAIAAVAFIVWQNWDKIRPALQPVVDVFNYFAGIVQTYLLPALSILWGYIQANLLPALQRLWDQLSPVLIPALKALAVVVGVVIVGGLALLIASLYVTSAVFTWLVNGITFGVSMIKLILGTVFHAITLPFRLAFDFVTGGWSRVMQTINSVNGWIGRALGGVFNSIVGPFRSAFDWIMSNVRKVQDSLSRLNPLKRHSPSLVDNIKLGMKAVKYEYGDMFGTLSRMALQSQADIHKSMGQTNNVSTSIYGNITIGNQQDAEYFMRRLSRNQELELMGLSPL